MNPKPLNEGAIGNVMCFKKIGVGKKNFGNNVFIMLGNTIPDILVLIEMTIPNRRGEAVLSALGFNKCELVEDHGFFGGISMVWKRQKCKY